MVSVFIFSGLPFGLNFVGQFLEIKRSDKTGAKIIDRVRQKHSDFTAVLSRLDAPRHYQSHGRR